MRLATDPATPQAAAASGLRRYNRAMLVKLAVVALATKVIG